MRLFCGKNRLFGPSDWFRTSGLVVPNHALYHLSYTRIFIRFSYSAVAVKHVVKGSCSRKLRGRGSAGTPVITRDCGISDFDRVPGVLHAPKPPALPAEPHPGNGYIIFQSNGNVKTINLTAEPFFKPSNRIFTVSHGNIYRLAPKKRLLGDMCLQMIKKSL